MTGTDQAVSKPSPILEWSRLLSVPIADLLGSWDGTEGAAYQELGIVLANGEILNLTCPERQFRRDASTVVVTFEDDLVDKEVPSDRILGHALKSLIYFDGVHGRHHLAVLDDGHYLTAYPAFNYTEFAYGSFEACRSGPQSRLSWGPLVLAHQEFLNAWTHERLDPFVIYR